MPNAPKTRKIIFTLNEKIMFCVTILHVNRDISTACANLEGSSVISTMSAASIAASEPNAPIATPMSAIERTGASFMPSPTKASLVLAVFFSINFSSISTFSCGKRPP